MSTYYKPYIGLNESGQAEFISHISSFGGNVSRHAVKFMLFTIFTFVPLKNEVKS